MQENTGLKRNAFRRRPRGFLAAVCGACVIAVVLVTLASQVSAQSKPPAPGSVAAISPSAPAVAEAADRLLKQMGAYIGSAERFTFHADVMFDHVLPTGQKLQFSATEDVALQRPNGLYVEWSSDLGNRQFWYDGKSATIYDSETSFYATDIAPPAIDGMLDKLFSQLNFTPPLVDFFYNDPYKSLRGMAQFGFPTGETQIDGRSCRGLAFVEKHIDWQIWIDTGPQLVPCKLVITYKNNPSLPQFSAVFRDWDFAPRIAVSIFTPDIPVTARKIPFATATASTGSKQ
ncbi:MAG TPA: DUF2092 domain-containing protein [Pseudolabrys sp.]|nr:DUF2092 domain-containing protein [Pseudolabrys sp.]